MTMAADTEFDLYFKVRPLFFGVSKLDVNNDIFHEWKLVAHARVKEKIALPEILL